MQMYAICHEIMGSRDSGIVYGLRANAIDAHDFVPEYVIGGKQLETGIVKHCRDLGKPFPARRTLPWRCPAILSPDRSRELSLRDRPVRKNISRACPHFARNRVEIRVRCDQ